MARKWKNLPIHTTYWGVIESVFMLLLMFAIVGLALTR